jgi:anti-sigma28 factor (negative regulator of flagellin synthesis)
MRVDDRNLNGAAGLQPGRAPETQEADRLGTNAGARIAESSHGDRAEISSLAGRVSEALATHTAARTERIAQLTQQYRAGHYKTNSSATSHAIIRDALERKDGAR